MTDREKLIAWIRDVSKFHEEVKEKWILGGKQGERPSLIESIADHLIANGVVVQRWIPVTERLPGTEKVLITNGDIVMRGYRRADGVWKYGVETHEVWENMSLRPVTHWMPLPEPPKEGE